MLVILAKFPQGVDFSARGFIGQVLQVLHTPLSVHSRPGVKLHDSSFVCFISDVIVAVFGKCLPKICGVDVQVTL